MNTTLKATTVRIPEPKLAQLRALKAALSRKHNHVIPLRTLLAEALDRYLALQSNRELLGEKEDAS